MEDSDSLIFLSLKQMGLELQTQSISKLSGDEIRLIAIHFLKNNGVDIKSYLSNESSQKYRVATKIAEDLKRVFAINFDFMVFINPNASDTRKFLVTLISRVASSTGESKPGDLQYTYDERIQNERNKYLTDSLKKWKNAEWILPELMEHNRASYQKYDIPIKNLREDNVLKVIPCTNPIKKQYLFNTIVNFVNKKQELAQKQYDFKTKTEKSKVAKTKKIVLSNQEAWLGVKRYMPKSILKNFDSNKLDIQQADNTLYTLELDFKLDDRDEGRKSELLAQNLMNNENDIETIRAKNKEEIDYLTKELKENQEILFTVESNLENLEEKKLKLEDDLRNVKIVNHETQKKIENLEKMLVILNDPSKSEKDLNLECKMIEDEIKQIQDSWADHKKELVEVITVYKTKIQENKDKFEEFQNNLKFIEGDYENLIQKIRNNYDTKTLLQNEYANMPKDLSRNIFIKRINDVNANFKKQQNELSKILDEVKQTEKGMDYSISLLERLYTEIENIIKGESKPDSLTKAILKLFNEYKTTFENTIINLKEQGKKKLESRELEQKIDILNSKGFKATTIKLQGDLKILKDENQMLSNSMGIAYQ